MSGIKKREVAPPPPRDALTQALIARNPAAASALQRAATALAPLRGACAPPAKWLLAKQQGARAMQALCNGWIDHHAARTSDAHLRAEFADAFGDGVEMSHAVLSALKSQAHEKAVRMAEKQLALMRTALQSLREVVDDQRNTLWLLQASWNDLFNATELAEGGDAELVSASGGDVDEGGTSPVPASSLGDMDAAVVPGAHISIQGCVNALAPVVRLYERELHAKSLLVHALDTMIHTDASNTSSAADDGEGLLSTRSSSSSSGVAATTTSVHALELYMSSWNLEAELDTDKLATTQHLWDSQLQTGAAK